MPQVGTNAPDFTLMDQDGRPVRLSEYRGRQVVLYFYPKDDTPGCTREACAFRDDHPVLSGANVVVLGVSPDTARSHKRFAEKFSLPFTLLADPEHQVADAYGVWVEKSMYGRTYMGIQRATFLVGTDGKLARVWPKVKVDEHAAEVREAVGLGGAGGASAGGGGGSAGKVPGAKSSGSRRTATSGARKTAARKTAPKRAQAKKVARKTTKRAAAKKGARKTAANRVPARKGVGKAAARKAPAKKAAKVTPRKRAPAKRAPARGATAKAAAAAQVGMQPMGGSGPIHKTQVTAKRATMRPGSNAPAGGAGTGVGNSTAT
ncbi:MAG: thioredoxin-dependent thiol peroxidase [Myxococcaceae bacterium]|nr:thioredoxin-dependent thiol peroxidase [Myxococcaceae bacterium]